jgi:uncharacterized delta-60 repeat protein
MKKIISCFLMLATLNYSYSQAGNLEPVFTANTNSANGFNDAVYSTAIQSDGKILVGGEFSNYNGVQSSCLIRLNADGTIDNTFNVGSGFTRINPTPRPYVHHIAIQDDGKIIVGGFFNAYNGTLKGNIVRLNSDGSIDNTFDPTGTTEPVRQIALQSDGKILVVGDFTMFNGGIKGRIIRLNSDGTTDASFNPLGSGANARIWTVKPLSNGKIYIGGEFLTYDGIPISNLTKLNADGTLDASYQGLNFNGPVRCITTVSNSSSIYVGGGFTNPAERIIKLLETGLVDASFSADHSIILYLSIVPTADDQIITMSEGLSSKSIK